MGVATSRERRRDLRRSQPRGRLAKTLVKYYPPVITLVVLIGAWQWIGSGLNPIFLSTPVKVVKAFNKLLSAGTLASNSWLTIQTFIIGLAISVIIGVPIGLVMGRYHFLRKYASVAVNMFNAMPAIALYTLFILWFGVGLRFRLALVIFTSVFAMIINAEAGVRSVDPLLVEVATLFGANERELFRKIVVPASIPFIAAGFKLAIGRAIVVTVTLELLSSTSGLGGMMGFYGTQFRTDFYFAPLIIIMLISFVAYAIGDWVERHYSRWRPASIS